MVGVEAIQSLWRREEQMAIAGQLITARMLNSQFVTAKCSTVSQTPLASAASRASYPSPATLLHWPGLHRAGEKGG